jgi:hypothetical protein
VTETDTNGQSADKRLLARQRSVAWRLKNPEAYKAINYRSYHKRKEKKLAADKAWRDGNPGWAAALILAYRTKRPWYRHWDSAKARCENPKHPSYRRYGGRGIKLKLSIEDCKKLWFRDNAASIHRPSIDRIDNNGDYTYENCQFISLSDNTKRMWERKRITDPGWNPNPKNRKPPYSKPN